MTLTTGYERDIEELHGEIKELREQELEQVRSMRLTCSKCNQTSAVKGFIFLQNHWYVRPSGCTDGDYWKRDEPLTCHLRCPRCNGDNYINNHRQVHKILDIVKWAREHSTLAEVFLEVIDRYKHWAPLEGETYTEKKKS